MKQPLFFQHAEDITLHIEFEHNLTLWMPSYLLTSCHTEDEYHYWRKKHLHLEGQVLNTKDKQTGLLKYTDIIFLK